MGLQVALLARDPLGRVIAAGIVAKFFTYTFMNIGMTISVTPVTGLPLPLISYGGTFLLTTLASVGLLQSIWVHRKTLS
jgi:rod shape determining protein RodA